MCQEILIDGKEVTRADDTCWCPLSGSYGAESEPAATADEQEQQKAYAELGKLVWQALCSPDRHVGAPEWISQITLKRW
jgi:hypothetical protein